MEIEAGIYQSNPWAGAVDWREIGRISILLSNFSLARGPAVLGGRKPYFVSPPPFSPTPFPPPGAGLEWSLGCPSAVNERGYV